MNTKYDEKQQIYVRQKSVVVLYICVIKFKNSDKNKRSIITLTASVLNYSYFSNTPHYNIFFINLEHDVGGL